MLVGLLLRWLAIRGLWGANRAKRWLRRQSDLDRLLVQVAMAMAAVIAMAMATNSELYEQALKYCMASWSAAMQAADNYIEANSK